MTIDEFLNGKYVAIYYHYGGVRIYTDTNHNFLYEDWYDVFPFVFYDPEITAILHRPTEGFQIGRGDRGHFRAHKGETLEQLIKDTK